MRVLHVVATGQRRGGEIFAADLVRALDDAGISQRVVVLRGNLSVPYAAPTVTLSPDGPRGLWQRAGTGALLTLRRLLSRWGPDVVQAHGGEALKYTVPAALGLPGTRVVYRRVGSAHRLVSRGMRRAAYAGLMRRAAMIVAVADSIRSETIRVFRVPSSRIVAIPNAVDVRRLEPAKPRGSVRDALAIPGAAPVVVSLGALTWEKDPRGQLDISHRVLQKRPDAVFLIVGDGPLRGRMQAAIRSRGLDGRVRLLGERQDVPELLTASDVLLLASRTEGMPGCVIEAGMLGVAVAGFALAGVSEVVLQGRTGLLTAAGDSEALAGAVVRLLSDDGARRTMGFEAKEWCRDQFDIRTIAPLYLELYEKLLAVPGAA